MDVPFFIDMFYSEFFTGFFLITFIAVFISSKMRLSRVVRTLSIIGLTVAFICFIILIFIINFLELYAWFVLIHIKLTFLGLICVGAICLGVLTGGLSRNMDAKISNDTRDLKQSLIIITPFCVALILGLAVTLLLDAYLYKTLFEPIKETF